MEKVSIFCVVGTRPEAIKMAPVILELKKQDWVDVKVVATAQHRAMLDQVLNFFGIQSDFDLDLMRPNQTLSSLTARLLTSVDEVLEAGKPDVVLVQGDTTTVMAVSLACFYRHILIGHVEAGLRTFDMQNPFPEEANRSIVAKLAQFHFAPTASSRKNLLRDSVDENSIDVTGNTVIDALLMTAEQDVPIGIELDPAKRMVLITVHRRENFGEPFLAICRALKRLALDNPTVQFLYPVHPNPNVKNVAETQLQGLPNVILCQPLDYAPFVSAMKRAHFIISDSGGVQEEAPALAKPVLVVRSETERPEAVEEGVVKLVGSDEALIVEQAQRLLDDPQAYAAMARGVSPYGDGLASKRIVDILKRYFTSHAAH